MWPVLFRIPLPEFAGGGYFPLRMFGVMVIAGFLAGTWVITRRLRKVGVVRAGKGDAISPAPGQISSEDVFDFCFYMLAVGILGSRLTYVAQNFDDFRGRFLDIFKIWQGGLVWYGGMALTTLFAFWWLWKRKLPVLKITDASALGVSIALAVGRWGCHFAGDDYGKTITDAAGVPVTDAAKAPWYAIQVPSKEHMGWRAEYCETPLHLREPLFLYPVQIYMSLMNLIVFALLLAIARRQKRHGILAASYLLLYPVGRFIIEFWRGDEDRGVSESTGLSFSQTFGIGVFLIGIMMLRAVKSRPADVTTAA